MENPLGFSPSIFPLIIANPPPINGRTCEGGSQIFFIPKSSSAVVPFAVNVPNDVLTSFSAAEPDTPNARLNGHCGGYINVNVVRNGIGIGQVKARGVWCEAGGGDGIYGGNGVVEWWGELGGYESKRLVGPSINYPRPMPANPNP